MPFSSYALLLLLLLASFLLFVCFSSFLVPYIFVLLFAASLKWINEISKWPLWKPKRLANSQKQDKNIGSSQQGTTTTTTTIRTAMPTIKSLKGLRQMHTDVEANYTCSNSTFKDWIRAHTLHTHIGLVISRESICHLVFWFSSSLHLNAPHRWCNTPYNALCIHACPIQWLHPFNETHHI